MSRAAESHANRKNPRKQRGYDAQPFLAFLRLSPGLPAHFTTGFTTTLETAPAA